LEQVYCMVLHRWLISEQTLQPQPDTGSD